MITKYQAGITIGFTLAALFVSQMSGDRLRSAVLRSFTDNVSEVGSQQSATSDRSGEKLNSDGTMYGVTLRRTRVYDTRGLQEPKSVLWKTPKLFPSQPEGTYSGPNEGGSLIRHDITYHPGLSIIMANKEAFFRLPMSIDGSYLLFAIDLQTGEIKKRIKLMGQFFSRLVVAGDFLFVGESKGGFYAFDRRDWKAKWEINKEGYCFDAPAVADGVVYFSRAHILHAPDRGTKGNVYAVDALTGTQKWMLTINGHPTPVQ